MISVVALTDTFGKMFYTGGMDTFRLWHDDDGCTFHAETNVYFSQCGKDRQLSLHELLKITSDIAVEDYRERGLSREVLLEHNLAILVSRCAFRFHRLPRENEHITVTTWEEPPEALQLRRAYRITAADGTPLVSGMSTWLLVNPVSRRIIPTKQFTLRTPPAAAREHDCLEPGKIIVPDDCRRLGGRTVGWSDLDANGHTNNSRYGAFLEDALPEAYREKAFTDFRINYSKEAVLGQELSVWGHFDDAAGRILLKGATESGPSFEGELLYRPD